MRASAALLAAALVVPSGVFAQPSSLTVPARYDSGRVSPELLIAQNRELLRVNDLFVGLIILVIGVTAVVVVASLLRQAFDYRRWVRQSRVQTEVHTKILDRMQSNEELLAYIQARPCLRPDVLNGHNRGK